MHFFFKFTSFCISLHWLFKITYLLNRQKFAYFLKSTFSLRQSHKRIQKTATNNCFHILNQLLFIFSNFLHSNDFFFVNKADSNIITKELLMWCTNFSRLKCRSEKISHYKQADKYCVLNFNSRLYWPIRLSWGVGYWHSANDMHNKTERKLRCDK